MRYFVLCLLLTGCLSTGYQPVGSGTGDLSVVSALQGWTASGGFYHQRVSANVFVVGFKGNNHTGIKKSYDFARLRAAEMAGEYGFTHFVIDGIRDKSSSNTIVTGSTSTVTGDAYEFGSFTDFSGTVTTTNDTTTNHFPGAEYTIRYFPAEPAKIYGKSYLATDVIKEIRSKYKMN